MGECLFLRTDYHQDCKSFAGPTDGNITECKSVSHNTCDSIIPEDCSYTGERLDYLEFGPGEILSIEGCQKLAATLKHSGEEVNFFVFLISSAECRLYRTMGQRCDVRGGPAVAPDSCYPLGV